MDEWNSTPRQIRRACQRIQRTWDDAERERRMVHYADSRNQAASDYKREPYTVPTIRVCDIAVAS